MDEDRKPRGRPEIDYRIDATPQELAEAMVAGGAPRNETSDDEGQS